MRKLGVEEWLVSAVMSMYTGAKTVVRTVYDNSSGFEVKVGMHQGSALSPLLSWPPCVANADIIFLPHGFFFFLSIFPHVFSAVADWMLLPHMV